MKYYEIKSEIIKGSVVSHNNSWMRVTARFHNTVNLGAIFSGKTSIKAVPLTDVEEDYEAWYDQWPLAESYKSM